MEINPLVSICLSHHSKRKFKSLQFDKNNGQNSLLVWNFDDDRNIDKDSDQTIYEKLNSDGPKNLEILLSHKICVDEQLLEATNTPATTVKLLRASVIDGRTSGLAPLNELH